MRKPSPQATVLSAAAHATRRRLLAGLAHVGAAGVGLSLGAAFSPATVRASSESDTTRIAAAREPDWDVPGGHFYTQTAPAGAPPDTGYVVTNADGMQFWRDYRALGGPAQLGYPVSSRYDADGVVYQALQAAVLCWNAETGGAEVFPIFAALADLDLDGWLEGQGIPPTSAYLLEDPGLPLEERLAWLTHPTLRAAFTAPNLAAGLARFGLPMGEPERFGPYLAQRLEKAVLQLWLDELPGQPPAGTVSLVQVGDLLKAAELVPEEALVPQPAPAPRPAPQTLPGQGTAPAAPAVAHNGGKHIVVSLSRQWWFAYEGERLVNSGPVTTGRPELATPAGRFSIQSRHSPFLFVSPWAPGSPFWYEPSWSTFALRITDNGVFLHDAPWRPFYGPGTNVPHYDPDGLWRTGSHGCINMPYAAAQWLWSFAPVGTPVDVIA